MIGKDSQTKPEAVGENFYNRGIMNAAVIAEAIRNAQKLTGKKDITGDEMRRGLEIAANHGGAVEGNGSRQFRGADGRELHRP